MEGKELVDFAAGILFDRRAEEIQLLELEGLSDVADYFLIATCQSEPQMKAILNTLTKELRRNGVKPLGVEYRAGVRWAVLDTGEMMVHLFEEEARKTYDLERLWADGKSTMLDKNDYIKEEDDFDNDNEFL